jgi:flavin reductase (DIM6/NTAB) family NADH-FMN oxidoreductase RutF
MTRWFKIYGNQYLGFWALGLVLFAVQEIPYINAPIIEEYPLTLECKVKSWDPETGYVIGEIVASQADESILTDGKVDLSKLRPIIFDPSFNVYRVVGEAVGNAFKDGLKLK